MVIVYKDRGIGKRESEKEKQDVMGLSKKNDQLKIIHGAILNVFPTVGKKLIKAITSPLLHKIKRKMDLKKTHVHSPFITWTIALVPSAFVGRQL